MSATEINIKESGTSSAVLTRMSSRMGVALASLVLASQATESVQTGEREAHQVAGPEGGEAIDVPAEPIYEERKTAEAVAAYTKLCRFSSMGSALSSLLSSVPADQHVHVALTGHLYDSPLDHDGVNPVRGELTVSVTL